PSMPAGKTIMSSSFTSTSPKRGVFSRINGRPSPEMVEPPYSILPAGPKLFRDLLETFSQAVTGWCREGRARKGTGAGGPCLKETPLPQEPLPQEPLPQEVNERRLDDARSGRQRGPVRVLGHFEVDEIGRASCRE